MKPRNEPLILAVLAVVVLTLGYAVFRSSSDAGAAGRVPGEPGNATGHIKPETLSGRDSPQRGASPARFTIVEFADFECPSCALSQPLLEEILKQRGDTRLVFRHLPLMDQHPGALPAAHAAEAARLQNRFWQMHDALYRRQSTWTTAADIDAALREVARSAGLDMKRFSEDMKSNERAVLERLETDQKAAREGSVEQTPSFFLITPTSIWAAVGPEGLKRLRDDPKYWQ